MSDSAEIWIIDPDVGESVSLYTHWGYEIVEDALYLTLRKRKRWNHHNYLCRMIFCQMLILTDEDLESDLNMGIGSMPGSSEMVLKVDIAEQRIYRLIIATDENGNFFEDKVLHIWTFNEYLDEKERLAFQKPLF